MQLAEEFQSQGIDLTPREEPNLCKMLHSIGPKPSALNQITRSLTFL
jgi:hypothetical protein